MSLWRTQDGDFIVGESDILSKSELMAVVELSRSTIQRYMRQGLPHILFDNNVTGFNLKEAQDWLERNKHLPPGHLRKRWEEHSRMMRKLKE